MREIKFRYIVKDEFGELHTIIKTLGQIAWSATHRNFSANNCEIVARDEWTGLLDANGREVYEGDRASDGSGMVYIIKWYEDKARFMKHPEGDDSTSYATGLENTRFLKVIGNIYENPELLE